MAAYPSKPKDGRVLGVATLFLGIALVYLNLIPLRFTGMPLDDWIRASMAMPWRHISLSGRADWVANLFMFVPFGFLLASTIGRGIRTGPGRSAVAVAALVVVAALAFAIEALQLLVPQRTVSLNDLLAGTLGGGLGILMWLTGGDALWRLWRKSVQPSRGALLAGLTLYTLGYVLLSAFPFDFVLGVQEFARKLESGNYALWMVDACGLGGRCLAHMGVEALSVFPIGMALALRQSWSPSLATAIRAALIGLLFGIVIELVQFLTYSGISQGVSLLTRACGFAAGALFIGWMSRRSVSEIRGSMRPWVFLAWPLYLAGIVFVAGILAASWGDPGSALRQLQTLNFLPFYYHYFTTEQAAMASLLYTLVLFFPVGVLVWLGFKDGRPRGMIALLIAVLIAFALESAKLIALELRPDPTNLLIAGFAGWLGFRAMAALAAALTASSPLPVGGTAVYAQPPRAEPPSNAAPVIPPGAPVAPPPRNPEAPRGRRSAVAILASVMLGAAVLYAGATHAISPAWALVGIVAVFLVTLRWPSSWLLLVPATLPILDLRPWTGRLYLDEWDLLVLAVLAALFLRRGLGLIPAASARILPAGRLWFGAYLVSYVLALLWALWPPAWPEPFAFTNLLSNEHGLRLAKGVLWAVLLWPFFHRVTADRVVAVSRFATGMVLGLMATVTVVLWERMVFPGLFNFSQNYRVTGMFSDTHTGGAFLEGYLVAAIPFLAVVLLWRRRWLWGGLAAVLFVLAVYSVGVTFARAGYAGLLVASLVLLLGLMYGFIRGGGIRWAVLAGVLVVAGAGTALLLYVQEGEFMGQRVDPTQIERDLGTRLEHWRETLQPVLRDTRAISIGLGIGQFPRVHFLERLARGETVPSVYELQRDEAGNTLLRLTPGLHTYHWQAVSIEPETEYRARARVRNAGTNQARLGILLCEQWLIYSRRCVWRSLEIEPGKDFSMVETTLPSRSPVTTFRFAQRPVKLVFYHSRGTDAIEVERISLTDPSGRELLLNGDFTQGLDRWFFASDDHLAWHIKHLWAQVFFEQGLVGLVFWTLLVLTALWNATRRVLRGGPQSLLDAAVLASLLGFLVVGLFDSLFDAPRLATLFFLLLLIATTDQGLDSASDPSVSGGGLLRKKWATRHRSSVVHDP